MVYIPYEECGCLCTLWGTPASGFQTPASHTIHTCIVRSLRGNFVCRYYFCQTTAVVAFTTRRLVLIGCGDGITQNEVNENSSNQSAKSYSTPATWSWNRRLFYRQIFIFYLPKNLKLNNLDLVCK